MGIAAELYYSDSWQDVSCYNQEGWKYKIGPSDITGLEPNSLELTLANDDLSMDPSNVTSPLYGLIGPNTPARLIDTTGVGAVTISDSFTRTASSSWGNATTGQTWTTAGGSASDFSVSSNVGRMSLGSINVSRRATLAGTVTGGEVYVTWTIPVDPTGDDIETSVMLHYVDSSNYMQASIFWDRENRPIELQFVRRVAGVSSTTSISHLADNPLGASLTCRQRVQWSGNNMRMKVWPAGNTEPTSWSLSARDDTYSSGQVGLRANLQPLFASGTPQVVTADNFSYAPLSFTILTSGEASSWEPDATVEHSPGVRGRSWTDLTAAGIQRRLGRWSESPLSPMRRQTRSYGSSLVGYWPLEDPVNSENLASEVAAVKPGTFTDGIELAGDDGPAGASAALIMATNEKISGLFQQNSGAGWQVIFHVKLDQTPADATYRAIFQWSDSEYRTWYWRVNNAGFQWEVYDDVGASIKQFASSFGTGIDPTNWIRYRFKVTTSGLNIVMEPSWNPQDGGAVGTSSTFTGVTVGTPRAWAVVGNAHTDGAAYSHVFAVNDPDLDIIGGASATGAFNAYNGETSRARFLRLMTENGLSSTVLGFDSQAAQMGRQPRGTLMEILQDLVTTEAGILYDEPVPNNSRCRLTLRLNNHLINQTASLALTKGVNVAPPLKKIIDDQRLANDITVVNWDGTEARVTDSTSSLGTANPPAGAGPYLQRLDVSFKWADSLEGRGNWDLRQNTNPRPRYANVTVDLLQIPALKASVSAVRPGDYITLAGQEADPIPLLVVQIERTGDTIRDKITFTCIPGDIFQVGTVTNARYFGSNSTTLAEDLTTTETIADVFTANPLEKWTTSAIGRDVIILGERCTITNVSTGSASGTGWAQSITLARSQNGIVKRQPLGATVQIFQVGRYALRSRL